MNVLSELPGNCYTHSYSFYRERKQMKISQQRKHMGCSPGKYQTWGSHCPLPTESGHIAFLALICDKTHGMMPTRDIQPGLSAQRFYWDPLHRHNWCFTAHVLVWPRITLDNIAGFSSVASPILRLSEFSQSPLCIIVLDYLVKIKTFFSAFIPKA